MKRAVAFILLISCALLAGCGSYSKDDIEEARWDGWLEGYDSGYEEGYGDAENDLWFASESSDVSSELREIYNDIEDDYGISPENAAHILEDYVSAGYGYSKDELENAVYALLDYVYAIEQVKYSNS